MPSIFLPAIHHRRTIQYHVYEVQSKNKRSKYSSHASQVIPVVTAVPKGPAAAYEHRMCLAKAIFTVLAF